MALSLKSAKTWFGLFVLGIVAALAFTALPVRGTPGTPVPLPGPQLHNPNNLAGVTAHNLAVKSYRSGAYRRALGLTSDALRSRHLIGQDKGFAFANLCVLYWRQAQWKQALAACVKAKSLLPGQTAVLENIQRIKLRERIN